MSVNVFESNIKWDDKVQVVALAKRLGAGLMVVRHADRHNYNIVHASRTDIWHKPGVTVVWSDR